MLWETRATARSTSFGMDQHLLQAAFYQVVLDKTIFVSRIKPSVSFLIHLHNNKPLEKTIAFKAVPGRRDLTGAYLRDIFPFPSEISNFVDLKGKTNISMIIGFPDLREEGRHLSVIHSTYVWQKQS